MDDGLKREGDAGRPGDPVLVAGHWWQENYRPLLPGETDGVTVFEILFQDQCRYFSFTGMSVFERLVELSSGVLDVRSNAFVSEHSRQLPYVVRCVASSLSRAAARELRDLLVAGAPDDRLRIDGTTVTSVDCWIKTAQEGVVVMSFAEWAKNERGGLK